MGNILSYANSPVGAPTTDDRWLKISASELFDIEVFFCNNFCPSSENLIIIIIYRWIVY